MDQRFLGHAHARGGRDEGQNGYLGAVSSTRVTWRRLKHGNLTYAIHESSHFPDNTTSRFQSTLGTLEYSSWVTFAPMQRRIREYRVKLGSNFRNDRFHFFRILNVCFECSFKPVLLRF